MVIQRRSRFDPEYKQDEDIYESFDDSDDEFSVMQKPKKSRFEDDNEPLFRINKRRQTTLFDKDSGEAFGDFEEEEDYDEEQGHKTPFLIRLFIWIAMLAVLGFAGYYASNYFMDNASARNNSKTADSESSKNIESEDKKEAETAATQQSEKTATKEYQLYIPSGKDYTLRRVEIQCGRVEQDIQKLLEMYFDSMREDGIISAEFRIQNIFKSGDLVYINTDSGFEKAIQSLDEAKATRMITAMLSTFDKNFSIRKVKFYINGKDSEIKIPVDLSLQWRL